jgi:hypothetical protein
MRLVTRWGEVGRRSPRLWWHKRAGMPQCYGRRVSTVALSPGGRSGPPTTGCLRRAWGDEFFMWRLRTFS